MPKRKRPEPINLICAKHDVAFVRFGKPPYSTFGCPQCVATIRSRVRTEINRDNKIISALAQRKSKC